MEKWNNTVFSCAKLFQATMAFQCSTSVPLSRYGWWHLSTTFEHIPWPSQDIHIPHRSLTSICVKSFSEISKCSRLLVTSRCPSNGSGRPKVRKRKWFRASFEQIFSSHVIDTDTYHTKMDDLQSCVHVKRQGTQKKRHYWGVSKNRGTPKSSILIGFSIINHPFWDTRIFGNTHNISSSNS